jgi:hypothetical protein
MTIRFKTDAQLAELDSPHSRQILRERRAFDSRMNGSARFMRDLSGSCEQPVTPLVSSCCLERIEMVDSRWCCVACFEPCGLTREVGR